ncbi:serine hydrolase [Bradyrhizobium sp. USDA 4486]
MDAWTRATHHNAIDRGLLRAIAQRDLPNVVAAAASEHGILYRGAFGSLGISQTASVDLDSIFWIGSLTELVMIVGLLQLAEAGKIGLEQPMSRLLPEHALVDVRLTSVSLHQFLTRSSVLQGRFSDSGGINYARAPGPVSAASKKIQMPSSRDGIVSGT